MNDNLLMVASHGAESNSHFETGLSAENCSSGNHLAHSRGSMHHFSCSIIYLDLPANYLLPNFNLNSVKTDISLVIAMDCKFRQL